MGFGLIGMLIIAGIVAIALGVIIAAVVLAVSKNKSPE